MIKSLLSTFTHIQKFPAKLSGRYVTRNAAGRANHNSFLVICSHDTVSEHEKTRLIFFFCDLFSSFNLLLLSLPRQQTKVNDFTVVTCS